MSDKNEISFERFFTLSENNRWQMERDIAWDAIEQDKVTEEELDTLRSAALTEGFSPTYAADLLDLYCDDPEMGPFLSIQFYEEYKHFHALRRYLRLMGREITDEEAVERRGIRTPYDSKLVPLLKFGFSEVFTAIFYRNLSTSTQEPVLAQLCKYIAADEYRHLRFYLGQLRRYVRLENLSGEDFIASVKGYQHQGLEAVDGWVDFWNENGTKYTGMEPYVFIQNQLSDITGSMVSMRDLMAATSGQGIPARTYQ